MNRQEILNEINKTKEHLADMEKMLEDKECMRALYKMFTEFKPKCRPTIISVSKDDFIGYTISRKIVFLTMSKDHATKYTDTARLYNAIKTVKKYGYNYELLEV